jgi:hypothetical protein
MKYITIVHYVVLYSYIMYYCYTILVRYIHSSLLNLQFSPIHVRFFSLSKKKPGYGIIHMHCTAGP